MPLHLLAKSGEMKRSGSQVSVTLKQGYPCSSPSEVDGDQYGKQLLGGGGRCGVAQLVSFLTRSSPWLSKCSHLHPVSA